MSDVSERNNIQEVVGKSMHQNDISEIKGTGNLIHQNWNKEELKQLKNELVDNIRS